MLNFKKTSLLLIVLTLLVSTTIFSQVKSSGKKTTASTQTNKDTVKIKNNTPPDSSAIKIKMILSRKVFDTIFLKDLYAYIDNLQLLSFTSGKIYFTGNGFYQTIAASFSGGISTSGAFENFFRRCVPGSKVVLEDCVYKNSEGIIIRSFTRSIFLK